ASATVSGSSRRKRLSILRRSFQVLLHSLGELVQNLIRFALDNAMTQGGQFAQDIHSCDKFNDGLAVLFTQVDVEIELHPATDLVVGSRSLSPDVREFLPLQNLDTGGKLDLERTD